MFNFETVTAPKLSLHIAITDVDNISTSVAAKFDAVAMPQREDSGADAFLRHRFSCVMAIQVQQ
jgi:hypothetical protein